MDLMELDLGVASACSMQDASPSRPLPLSPPPHKHCPSCCPVSGGFILPGSLNSSALPPFPRAPCIRVLGLEAIYMATRTVQITTKSLEVKPTTSTGIIESYSIIHQLRTTRNGHLFYMYYHIWVWKVFRNWGMIFCLWFSNSKL
jgi:hypothetical protein